MISSATVIKFFSGPEKKKKDTVKMLTREGRLVEIDRKLIHSSKRNMITDPELKAWVKK